MSFLNWTMSQARRVSHFLIIVVTFSLAIVLGQYSTELVEYQQVSKIRVALDCDEAHLSVCIQRQLLYRASLSLFGLFAVLCILSRFSSWADRSFWPVKFAAAIGMFGALLWVDNATFATWASCSQILSFFWLLAQGLLVLELGYLIHDVIMQAAANEERKSNGDSRTYLVIYLLCSCALLSFVVVGLVFLFSASYSGCALGRFFSITTVVVGVLSTLVSLLHVVNKGLLTPLMMFSYSVVMCWYSLLSSPDVKCNPSANATRSSLVNASIAIMASISAAIILFCVCWGSKILQIFNPNGEPLLGSGGDDDARRDLEVVLVGKEGGATKKVSKLPYTTTPAGAEEHGEDQDSESRPQERMFFHALMALASAFFGMVLTSFGAADGSPTSQNVEASNESLWLKISAQWIFLGLYAKTLHAAYISNSD